MAIGFNEIPSSALLANVYVEFDSSGAVVGLATWPNRIFIFAPKIAAGNATALFQYTTDADLVTKLGRGSIGVQMVREARAASKKLVEMWVMPVTDGGGTVAAVKTIAVTAAPTAAGTLALYVGGRRYQVGVLSTDTTSSVATKIAAAIAADLDAPFTAAAATSNVTITSRHAGTIGNDIQVTDSLDRINEVRPTGLTYTVTQTTAGSGTADVAALIASIPEKKYNTICLPYSDNTNLTALEAELDRRWGPLAPFDGHAFTCVRGDVASLNTWASTRNNAHLTPMALENTANKPVWSMAAEAAGAAAYYLGDVDQARPLQRKAIFTGYSAPDGSRFVNTDRELLAQYGFGTQKVSEGGEWQVEYLATTNTLNSAGESSTAYGVAEVLYTLSYLRYSLIAFYTQNFPDYKLASDGSRIPQGQPIVTPSILNAAGAELHELWIDKGLVEGKYSGFFERNTTNRDRVDAVLKPDVMNQFRILAVKMSYVR